MAFKTRCLPLFCVLSQWFSKSNLQTSSISISWELVKMCQTALHLCYLNLTLYKDSYLQLIFFPWRMHNYSKSIKEYPRGIVTHWNICLVKIVANLPWRFWTKDSWHSRMAQFQFYLGAESWIITSPIFHVILGNSHKSRPQFSH